MSFFNNVLNSVKSSYNDVQRFKDDNATKAANGQMWYQTIGDDVQQLGNRASAFVNNSVDEAKLAAVEAARQIEAFKQENARKQAEGTMWYQDRNLLDKFGL